LGSEVKYSEDELVLLLQQRNQDAFSYLYDNYAGALNATILKIVDNKVLAEDILQDAFVKIWHNFSSYDKSKGRLFTWMLNITKNLTIDTIRSKGYRNQMKISSDENSVSEVQDAQTGIDKYDAMGMRKQLLQLKPDLRTIIDLSYFGGFTQDEIAKIIGIPIGTVKTRMRTALIELRKNIQ
jgi:RNA polymerase sigma factor (sigma-70 family)